MTDIETDGEHPVLLSDGDLLAECDVYGFAAAGLVVSTGTKLKRQSALRMAQRA